MALAASQARQKLVLVNLAGRRLRILKTVIPCDWKRVGAGRRGAAFSPEFSPRKGSVTIRAYSSKSNLLLVDGMTF